MKKKLVFFVAIVLIPATFAFGRRHSPVHNERCEMHDVRTNSFNCAENTSSRTCSEISSFTNETDLNGSSFMHYCYAVGIGGVIAAIIIFFLVLLIHTLLFRRFFDILEARLRRNHFENQIALLYRLRKPISSIILLCGAAAIAQFLVISAPILLFIDRFFHSMILFFVTWIVMCLVDTLFDSFSQRTRYQTSEYYGILPLLKRSCRVIICVIGILLLIDGLGFSVNGIFATLGIGGAIIALAAKDSVANIFGSLAIVLDHPFKVGDWIRVGDGTIEGDVEQIGLRSTRIRTHAKTLMTVPNFILSNEVIDNWSRMFRRRVRQFIHVNSNAQPQQLQEFIEDVESILREDKDVFSEMHFCALCEFETTFIQIMVYYFTLAIDLEPHMRIRNRINVQILMAAQKAGITLSVPHETRHCVIQNVDMEMHV
jgi:MscS family membrane protein